MGPSTTRQGALGIIVAGLLALAGPAATHAEGDPGRPDVDAHEPRATFQAHVESNPNGVDIHITGRETVPREAPPSPVPAPAAAGPPAPGTIAVTTADQPSPPVTHAWADESGMHQIAPDGTRSDLAPPTIAPSSQDSWAQEAQQHFQQRPWLLTVNDQFQGVVWLPDLPPPMITTQPPDAPPDIRPGGNGGTDPHDVALDMIAHIPLPDIHLKVNPDLGLVAIPEWFWIEGYDGRPFGQSRTVTLPPPGPGLPPTSFTVTVRVWPREYEWAFGDGQQFVTQSIGNAYPLESDIQHVYQQSSFAFSQGYPLWLTVKYGAEYQVNGGAWQPLPNIQHTYQTTHQVQEIQSILDRPKQP